MASTPTEIDRYYAALADMAEALRHEILGMDDALRSDHVTDLVERSETAFGVWPDGHEPGGYGFHLIKGPDRGGAAALALPDAETTVAIPCAGWRQAVAAQEVWGEKRPARAVPAKKRPAAARRKRKTAAGAK